jgi:hypothetical protein
VTWINLCRASLQLLALGAAGPAVKTFRPLAQVFTVRGLRECEEFTPCI